MISVQNLVKQYGARRAVDDVSFEVEKGTVLGFLGPNGAGKSTTMRMITGFIRPTSGTAVIDGHDILKDPVNARKKIGYLPESAPSYADMTVKEFLRFMAEMRGFGGSERNKKVEEVIEKCFLETVSNQTIDTLSKGYRQRTCFAQAILHNPPVLIMDEPTDGLDPNQKGVVREMIKEMAQEKVIILSTHVLEEVSAVCSRIIIISGGKLVEDSTPAELTKDCSLEDVFRRITSTDDVAHAAQSNTPEEVSS
jgi:ABC-2 type transport system ATP-binding protein